MVQFWEAKRFPQSAASTDSPRSGTVQLPGTGVVELVDEVVDEVVEVVTVVVDVEDEIVIVEVVHASRTYYVCVWSLSPCTCLHS